MLEIRAMLPITPRASMLIAVSTVMTVIVALVVTLRMIRNIKFKKLGWDEALIILATIVQFASTGVYLASVPYGNGRHIYQFPDIRENMNAIILPWVGQPLSAVCLLLAKSSLAATLLNLGLGKKFNWIVMSAVSLIAIAVVWAIIQILVGCNPVAHPDAGPCTANGVTQAGALFMCSANILVDLIFFAAPEYFLRKTKLHARDRLAIRCLLGFVFLATIASIVKVIYLRVLLRSGDVTWYSPPVSAASELESGLSIVAACLPAVRQLIGQRFPKHLMFWKTSTDTSGSYGTNALSSVRRSGAYKGADLERGKNKANIKVFNDLDLPEEDADVVELIARSPKPYDKRSTVRYSLDAASHSNDVAGNPTAHSSEPLSAPRTTLPPVDNRANSLEGRLSSRYRSLDTREDTVKEHDFASDPVQTRPSLAMIKQAHPDTSILKPYTHARIASDTISESGLSSNLSSRPSSWSHGRPSPMTPDENGTLLVPPNISSLSIPLTDHQSSEDKTSFRNHRSTDSVATMTALPAPAALYYYENKKVRCSARSSLDTHRRQSSYAALHSRTSTLDSNGGFHDTGTSWLKATGPKTTMGSF